MQFRCVLPIFFWGGWILNHLLIVLTSLFTKVSKIATFFEEFFFGSFCWSLVHLWFHLTPMGVVAPCQWQSKNNDWNLGCEDWRFASWEGGYKHPKLHKNLSVFCLCVYSVLLSTNMSNEKKLWLFRLYQGLCYPNGDYFINHEIRIPFFEQPGWLMESKGPRFFSRDLMWIWYLTFLGLVQGGPRIQLEVGAHTVTPFIGVIIPVYQFILGPFIGIISLHL